MTSAKDPPARQPSEHELMAGGGTTFLPGSGVPFGVRQARSRGRRVRVVRRVEPHETAAARDRHPATGGARQRRLEERRRQRVRRRGLLGTASLVVLGLVAASALGVFVQRRIGGDAPADSGPPHRPTQVATLVSIGDPVRIDDIAVFALSPEEDLAIVVLIPAGTRVEVPGSGLASLTEAYAIGGPALLETAVANLLGVRFDGRAVIYQGELSSVFRRVSPIHVDVPQRVTIAHPDGRIEVKFAAGPQKLSAEQLVEFMTFPGATDIDRVARQQLAWESWFQAAGAGAGRDLRAADLGAHAPVLEKVFEKAGETIREYQILPVQSAGVGGDVEIFQPKADEIRLMVERVLAGALPEEALDGRLRVDIRNGNGRIGVSQKVAALLVPMGYNVVITGNADHFRYEDTQVVFYAEDVEGAARDVVGVLGTGRLILNRLPSGVADITVIVGKDFPRS